MRGQELVVMVLSASCLALAIVSILYEWWRVRKNQLREQHDVEAAFLDNFIRPFAALLGKDAFIPSSDWKPMIYLARNNAKFLRGKRNLLLKETLAGLATFFSAEDKIRSHNKEFVEHELERQRDFFDNVAKYPLDTQQRECCIIDEDAGLVVAGAGSGKTSSIQAKVAYLLKVKRVQPSEILLLSFTNKAAQEMTDRIAACVGDGVISATTFHKLGLGIIKLFENRPYDVADEDFLKKLVHKTFSGDEDFAPDEYAAIVQFFAYHLNEDKQCESDSSLGERITREKAQGLSTLKNMLVEDGKNMTLGGEFVKSLEEVKIANFLFINGVSYEYEKKYGKPYERDSSRRAYHPDFYLPEFDVYIEHYGIDENGEPPSFFSDAEKAKYKDGIAWKRKLHAAAGNKYVESYSWWNKNGELLSNLSSALTNVGVAFKPRDAREVLRLIGEKAVNKLNELEKLIVSFISLYKANGFPVEHFESLSNLKASTSEETKRQRCFLGIAREIFVRYQEALKESNTYDFSDMINKATEIVEAKSPGTVNYKYIIVDEYQDVSVARMRLLQALVKNSGAHIFCVGDDWQSIFRFAGSDVSLFTRFRDYFGDAVMMRIENTYRNSQELIDVMGRFVMQNPSQLPKNLKSSKHCDNPICPMPFTKAVGMYPAIVESLKSIIKELAGAKGSVLLIGRTKYDEKYVKECRFFVSTKASGGYVIPQYPNLSFQFLTAHKAKGLEGDYVILLNAENSQLGFPNQIADDPILQLVLSSAEKFDFAEERRLFYVALTRTRNKVFVVAPSDGYSPFMDDIFKIGVPRPLAFGESAEEEKVLCPKCKTGVLKVRNGSGSAFTSCSNYPYCDYSVHLKVTASTPRCPSCGAFLVKRRSKSNGFPFLGCTNYPYCHYTERVVPKK